MIDPKKVADITDSISVVQQILENIAQGKDPVEAEHDNPHTYYDLSDILSEVREHLWETLAPEVMIIHSKAEKNLFKS